MANQPGPPQTRQSGPQAKPSDPAKELHKLKPGGPIKPSQQGFVNPGPTDNLRGVEHNTSMHRGTPNPEQHGTHKNREDHNAPPLAPAAANTHPPMVHNFPAGKHSQVGTVAKGVAPNEKGVKK
jgi:hypothetical protein